MPAQRRPTRLNLAFLTALTAFGIAMGHLEAVVVVYIRHIMGIVPIPAQLDPAVMAKVPPWAILSEQGREAATIIMLAALGFLAGRTVLEKLATFLYAFAVWDIFYYVSLKVQLDWPASLKTLDCLFLIPKAWYAPVWLPLLASLGLIAIALVMFALAQRRRGG
jgi:hypothetical protein